MTIYGDAAVKATELLVSKKCNSPRVAWDWAIKAFTKSEESRKKVCPRNAYLGLCGAGLVKGVVCDEYAKNENGEYAVELVRVIKANPEIVSIPQEELFHKVAPGVKENGQVGVVFALFENKLIVF